AGPVGRRLHRHGGRRRGHLRGRGRRRPAARPPDPRSPTLRRFPMSTTDTPAVDPSTLTPLEEACEWHSDEVGDSYIFQLTDAHVAELDAALATAEAKTADLLDVEREHFPLPTLGPELA